MLSEAIEFPLEGDDVLERVLVGGVLVLLSPLVVPGVLLGGYSVAVVRSVLAGRTEPPAVDDWGDHLRDGLSVLAIAVVYWLPGLVLAGLGLGVLTFVMLLGFGGSVLVFMLGSVGGVVGLAYGLAVSYVLPAAIVNYARTDEIGAAWDVDALRTIVTDDEYATAWLGGTALVLVVDTVGAALSLLLVGFAVIFVGLVMVTYLYTRGVMAALDIEPEPQTPPSSPEEGADEAGDGVSPDGADAADATDAPSADDGPADGDTEAAGTSGAEAGDGGDADRTLTDVDGVGPATAESLRDAGFASVADLRAASRDDLADVDGIGPAKADQIKRDL